MNMQKSKHQDPFGRSWWSFRDQATGLCADWRIGSPVVWVTRHQGQEYIGARYHRVRKPSVRRILESVQEIFMEIIPQ